MSNIVQVDFKKKSYGDLQLVLMPGNGSGARDQNNYYEKAFKLWFNVWASTLKELDGLKHLPSDQFTRQDLVAGVFLRGDCIALTCYRKANLASVVDRRDSWFTPWTEETMVGLSKKYPRSAANSFFTLHPEFRKSLATDRPVLPGIDVSLVLAELVALISYSSGADATYGVTRNNRSVNKLAYHGGAIPIAQDQVHHGVSVDLIAFLPSNVQIAMQKFLPTTGELWNSRTEYTKYNFEKDVSHAEAA